MMPKSRFSIKLLFLLTSVVALVLAAIQFRPSPQIRVSFQTNETVTINDKTVDIAVLRDTIDRERFLRQMWMQRSDVVVVLPESILANDDFLSNNSTANSIEELINPTPKKRVIHVWDIADFLEEHKLSDLDNFVIGGVNQGIVDPIQAR